ncbi:MAG: SDR family oxidoreductase [Actinomycetota bacterium]
MTQHRSFENGFAGSSVLIAGATGGIGSALARELSDRGAAVTLVARQADRLEQLDIPGARLALDLRSMDHCHQAIHQAKAATGKLDAVINAVGVVAFGPVADLSIDAMEELFLTNTFIPMMLAQAAVDHLSPGGVLVNLSGVIAERNLPGMAAYGASKAAVAAFDTALAREVRRAEIRVLDARPPHTETGLADRAIEGSAPLMREGLQPERVAKVICDAIEQGVDDLPSTAF